jgi:alkylation response protein AidB-like acyl-CoA dehydrogenase
MIESPEHVELRTSLRRLLERQADEQAVRTIADTSASGFDAALWKRLAQELGVTGLAVPESLDGVGYGVRELAIVAEELGRRLVPSPFLASIVMATQVLVESGDDDVAGEWVPQLVAGEVLATVLLPHHGAGWSIDATSVTAETGADGGSRLTGRVTHVIDGGEAQLLLVPARSADGDVQLYAVTGDSGVVRTPTPAMDQTRRFADVDLADAPAQRLATSDPQAVVDAALTRAAACLAAEQTGVGQAMLDAAVEYAKVRQQFGRAIGSYQAIKHKLADALLSLELARATVSDALLQLDAGGPTASRDVSIAKLVSSQAGYEACAQAIQVFGGIGVTWEHVAHLYFKRAVGNRVLLGDEAYHRRAIAAAIGLGAAGEPAAVDGSDSRNASVAAGDSRS